MSDSRPPALSHDWLVVEAAPPKTFEPEGIRCSKCGIKGLRWVGHYTVEVDDIHAAIAQRAWEHWKVTKWVSHVCYGPRKPRPPPGVK